MLKAKEEKLLAEALLLPATTRAAIAGRLLRSLDADDDEDPSEVDAAWTMETARRRGELSTGAVKAMTPEEALKLITSDDPSDDDR